MPVTKTKYSPGTATVRNLISTVTQNTVTTNSDTVIASTLQENQYTKALYFGRTITQTGSVHDFSRNNNDLIFSGGITNAEVYNTELNTISVPQLADKCLQIDPSKFSWQLQNGESLFMQLRFKVVDLSAAGHVMGWSIQATQPGMAFIANSAGTLILNTKIGTATGIGLQATGVLTANTYVNLTIWVDGATRILNGWINGVQPAVWTNVQLVSDGTGRFDTAFITPVAFQLGGSGSVNFPATTGGAVSRACRFETIRLLTLPASKMLQNAAMLDWKFNTQPVSLLTDADLSLV